MNSDRMFRCCPIITNEIELDALVERRKISRRASMGNYAEFFKSAEYEIVHLRFDKISDGVVSCGQWLGFLCSLVILVGLFAILDSTPIGKAGAAVIGAALLPVLLTVVSVWLVDKSFSVFVRVRKYRIWIGYWQCVLGTARKFGVIVHQGDAIHTFEVTKRGSRRSGQARCRMSLSASLLVFVCRVGGRGLDIIRSQAP